MSFYAEVQKKHDLKPSINNEKKRKEKNLSLAIPGVLAEGVGDEDGPVEC